MLEKDMRPAVHAWLIGQGLTVIYEFTMYRRCDMVGVRFTEGLRRHVQPVIDAVAVELKLTDVGCALHQAIGHRTMVRSSFVAMPWSRVAKMTTRTKLRFTKENVGLLAICVADGRVMLEIPPGPSPPDINLQCLGSRWWNRVLSDKRMGREHGPSK